MRLNTRNFFIYILVVGILLIGITTTASLNHTNQLATILKVVNENGATTSEMTYGAEVVTARNILDKDARLVAMREKVSLTEPQKISQRETIESEPIIENKIDESMQSKIDIKKCSDFKSYKQTQDFGPASFSVVEGARVLTPLQSEISSTTNSSTTVVIQLPLPNSRASTESCLSSDVVAVALDGSLIRNNESDIYSIFSAETLLGYGLDGFPLYGKNDQLQLDNCGGAVVDGQYRYYLQSKRESILNCFAGNPVKL